MRTASLSAERPGGADDGDQAERAGEHPPGRARSWRPGRTGSGAVTRTTGRPASWARNRSSLTVSGFRPSKTRAKPQLRATASAARSASAGSSTGVAVPWTTRPGRASDTLSSAVRLRYQSARLPNPESR